MSLSFIALAVSIAVYATCAGDQAWRGEYWPALLYACYGLANFALLQMTK